MDIQKLKRCRELRRTVETFQERLANCEPSVSASLDPTPRGTRISKPTEDAAIKMVTVEELMNDAIEEYNQLAWEISLATRKLDTVERAVIIFRYIRGDSWETIAEALHYSESHLYDLHRKALEELKTIENHS